MLDRTSHTTRETPTQASRAAVAPVAPPGPDPSEPEWTTERWKHRVEAEARHRLKDEVRDVAKSR